MTGKTYQVNNTWSIIDNCYNAQELYPDYWKGWLFIENDDVLPFYIVSFNQLQTIGWIKLPKLTFGNVRHTWVKLA